MTFSEDELMVIASSRSVVTRMPRRTRRKRTTMSLAADRELAAADADAAARSGLAGDGDVVLRDAEIADERLIQPLTSNTTVRLPAVTQSRSEPAPESASVVT